MWVGVGASFNSNIFNFQGFGCDDDDESNV